MTSRKDLMLKFWDRLNTSQKSHSMKAQRFEVDPLLPERTSAYESGVAEGLGQAKRMIQQFIYDEGL